VMPVGKVQLEINFSRTGDVADLKVEHHENAYTLKTLRTPDAIQGVMPLNIRSNIGDWTVQRTTDKYVHASCRIEPQLVSTFDNKTYAYTINDYEHVLLMDGSKTLPIAVLARTVSGEQKEVKILSGETKVEIIPGGPSSLKVKLNGQERAINQGETFIQKNSQTGDAIVEIKHFQDGVYHVYVATQMLHVLTDGKSVEVVAPQLLKNRAVGLCGDLNGEEVADLPSPQKCIMKPKLAAESYMLPKGGNTYPSAGVPHSDREELNAEIHECAKEIVVPTPIIPLFERALTAPMPLLSAHKVEKQMNKVCISKEKIKTCGGASGASSQGGMTQKTVKFACVAAPSTQAQTLEKRAMAGDSLGAELTGFSTAYTKMEAEPMYCGSYGATGGMGGMGMGANSEFGSYGNSGIGGGSGSSFGNGGSSPSSGATGGMGGNNEFESHGNSGLGGGYGSSFGNGGSAPSSGATGGMEGNSEFGSYGNSGIGGGSGSSSGAGSAPLRPITFYFNAATQTETLPNGDKIRMDKTCNVAGLSPTAIRIMMRGTGGAMARGVSSCPRPSPDSCRNILRVKQNEMKSIDVRVFKLHVAYMLAFDKVDARNGVSTLEYEIKNKDDMKPGCSYMFTFL